MSFTQFTDSTPNYKFAYIVFTTVFGSSVLTKNAPECRIMHLQSQKFSGGDTPRIPAIMLGPRSGHSTFQNMSPPLAMQVARDIQSKNEWYVSLWLTICHIAEQEVYRSAARVDLLNRSYLRTGYRSRNADARGRRGHRLWWLRLMIKPIPFDIRYIGERSR